MTGKQTVIVFVAFVASNLFWWAYGARQGASMAYERGYAHAVCQLHFGGKCEVTYHRSNRQENVR
jgi:hypothetical protein